MNIAGIGTIFNRGRGIDRLETALEEGWRPPVPADFNGILKPPVSVYGVHGKDLREKALSRKIRRADRFSRMAVVAAWDALRDGGPDPVGRGESMGVIVATAFGPHATTFRFLDDILDYGDGNVSPTVFSHSVHNAAAAYIAAVLDVRGPTLTLTQFDFPFHHALLLAGAWLRQGRCETVLVGTVDELGPVMAYACREKLKTAPDGKIRPFHFSHHPETVPGEGSAFFLLRKTIGENDYASIPHVSFGNGPGYPGLPDLRLLDAGGMNGDESGYAVLAGTAVAGYTPLFGGMITDTGFHCATAALMLRNQKQYACPVPDNPKGANVCTTTKTAALGTIACIKIGCLQKNAAVILKKGV